MATTVEIERIAALVEQLLPLRSRRRGELIEADDWNTVVGVLLEVARAVVADREQEVATHTHPDQVSASWLDPTLRARLEKGPLADPASVARVAKVERDLVGLRGSLDRVHDDVRGVRGAADRLAAADLARESSLTRVVRRVEGLGDARDDVGAVRETLDTLREDLARVSAFADDLQLGDRVLTVDELVAGLERVDGLVERLTSPDGTAFSATGLELRLAELENTLVTEDELDQAFVDRGGGALTDDVREQLLADARLAADERAGSVVDDLEGRLRDSISSRLDDVEGVATTAAATRAEEVADQRVDALREDLAATVAAGDDAVRASIDEAVSGLAERVDADLEERLGGLSSTIEARVDERLAGSVGELVDPLRAELDEVRSRLDPLADAATTASRDAEQALAAVAAVDRGLAGVIEEVDAAVASRVETELAAARTAWRAADGELLDRLRSELAAERQRVDTQIAALRTQIPRAVDDAVRSLQREFDATVDQRLDVLRGELQHEIDTVRLRTDTRIDPTRFDRTRFDDPR